MRSRITFFLFLTLLTTCVKQSEQKIEPPSIEMAEVKVFFLDEARFAAGTEPYEAAVIREIHPDAFLPRLALQAYFDGPTEQESARGLRAELSNCTGFSDFTIEEGIAKVYLTGPCSSGGSTYTIANPVMLTLKEFAEIEFVKLYDSHGITGSPESRSDSIPFTLEP